MNKRKSEDYKIIERIFWIQNRQEFKLKDYMARFEISRSTAFRDLDFIRGRLFQYFDIEYDTNAGKYKVIKQ